jgi:hypothetical protein
LLQWDPLPPNFLFIATRNGSEGRSAMKREMFTRKFFLIFMTVKVSEIGAEKAATIVDGRFCCEKGRWPACWDIHGQDSEFLSLLLSPLLSESERSSWRSLSAEIRKLGRAMRFWESAVRLVPAFQDNEPNCLGKFWWKFKKKHCSCDCHRMIREAFGCSGAITSRWPSDGSKSSTALRDQRWLRLTKEGDRFAIFEW